MHTRFGTDTFIPVAPDCVHVMASDTAPAVRGRYDETYSGLERIEKIGERVNFHRGFGTTGSRVVLMDASSIGGCPRCGESEMVASIGLHPEAQYDALALYCTNLRCRHFVGSEVEFDMEKIRADTPSVWDETAFCPECESTHTVRMTRHKKSLSDDHTGDSHAESEVLCDSCIESESGEVSA
jgi:ribosomal protein S27AE